MTPENSGEIMEDIFTGEKFLSDGSGQNSVLPTRKPSALSPKPQENILVDLKPTLEVWRQMREEILSRKEYPEYPIGLKDIDEVIWGLHKKELLTIGARTSVGKSDFAINIANNLADKKYRIIYFSLEMSKEQLVERLFSNQFEIDNMRLRKGKASDDILRYEKSFESYLIGINLLIDDHYGFYYDKVINVCELIKPDFIIVDHIQMISPAGFKSKLEAIEEYVRKLKQLSLDLNFGTILLSQINRAGVEAPSMENLKWAGILEEASDTVLLLRWEWEANQYFVNVSKQRHGMVKSNIEIKFYPEFSKFTDIGVDLYKKPEMGYHEKERL